MNDRQTTQLIMVLTAVVVELRLAHVSPGLSTEQVAQLRRVEWQAVTQELAP